MRSDPKEPFDQPVNCKHCGRLTTMTGTQLCDGCWEIEHRIEHIKAMIWRSQEFADLMIDTLLASERVAHIVRVGDSVSHPIVMINDIHLDSPKDGKHTTIEELKNQIADEMVRVFGEHWYIEEFTTR